MECLLRLAISTDWDIILIEIDVSYKEGIKVLQLICLLEKHCIKKKRMIEFPISWLNLNAIFFDSINIR